MTNTAPRVKALEFHKPFTSKTLSRADTKLGSYRVYTHADAGGQWFWSFMGTAETCSGECGSETEAIARAQDHFSAGILAALDPVNNDPNQPATDYGRGYADGVISAKAALEPQEAEPAGWPLELAKMAMVEASGLSPLWGEDAAMKGAFACITEYLRASRQLDASPDPFAAPVPASEKAAGVTDAMVEAAEAAVYKRHERGFLIKPLVDPIDMRAALEAALSVSHPVQGWQTMDSAPKTGEEILGCGFSSGPPVRSMRWGSGSYDRSKRAYEGAWVNIPGHPLDPKLWAPLPAGPSSKETASEPEPEFTLYESLMIEAGASPDKIRADRLSAASSKETAPEGSLCSDCPPKDYPTDKTRCDPCPRHSKDGDTPR